MSQDWNPVSFLQLEYFLMAARERSFTSAAQKLYISQPALSKQIALLEERLKTTLFYRERRQVTLTPPGEVLFQGLTTVHNQVCLALEQAKEAGERFNHQVNVGCLETVRMGGILQPMIQRFHRDYPQYTLSNRRYSFRTLVERLERHQLDVIFTLSFEQSYLERLGFVCRPVERRSVGVVCSGSTPYAAMARQGVYAFQDATLVAIEPGESEQGNARARENCRRLGIALKEVVEVPNVASLLSTLATGTGFSFLERDMLQAADGQLEFYPLPEEKHIFYLICAWNPRNLSPAAEAFQRLIQG